MTSDHVMQSGKLALVLFAVAVLIAMLGGFVGYAVGGAETEGTCYRIKTERCLGEPLETECVCDGANGSVVVVP
jgi:hypothetical protein